MYSHNHFQVQVIRDMDEAAHLHPDVELVYEELLYDNRSASYKYSLLYRILDQLIEHFMEEHAGGRLLKDDRQDDEKLQ